jgi:transcriptional regulator with XRE-family HTH domain
MGTHVGQLLKDARERAGLSQKDLAQQLQYESPQFISNIERGLATIPADKLIEICEILDKRPSAFIQAFKEDYLDELDDKVKKLKDSLEL